VNFKKYIHIERFGTKEVENINIGTCFLFSKVDGSCSSVFLKNGIVACGSRNRELSPDQQDNHGFRQWVSTQDQFNRFFNKYPDLILYGEFLVPHSLKTYRSDTWRKLYIFDVLRDDKFLSYDEYVPLLEEFRIEYIPVMSIIKNPTYEDLVAKLQSNTYLIEDGKGCGEGIVIKNYDFVNRYGRQTWAKIVCTEFKEKNLMAFKPKEQQGSTNIEQKIIEEFLTITIIDKVYANIISDKEWESRFIQQLLGTVFYDLIREESWNFVKKYKFPKIDFNLLQKLCYQKVKEVKKDLF
jgi:hypothetical protein